MSRRPADRARPVDLSQSWCWTPDDDALSERIDAVDEPLGESYATTEALETEVSDAAAPPPAAAAAARACATALPPGSAPPASAPAAETPAPQGKCSAELSFVTLVRTVKSELSHIFSLLSSHCINASRWQACVLGLLLGGVVGSIAGAVRPHNDPSIVFLTGDVRRDIAINRLSRELGVRRQGFA